MTQADERRNRYQAAYTVTFKGSDVKAAQAVHDALTEIPQAKVEALEFSKSSMETLEADVFRSAIRDAQERLATQCQLLGLKVDDYRVVSWKVEEDGRVGKSLAITPGSNDYLPGNHVYKLKVFVTYQR